MEAVRCREGFYVKLKKKKIEECGDMKGKKWKLSQWRNSKFNSAGSPQCI